MSETSPIGVEEEQFRPKPAYLLEETGLSHSLVLDLVLKFALREGTVSQSALAHQTKLSSTIIHSIYRHLQKEQLCDTRPMIGEDYEISLTARGRSMAEVAMKRSQYVGPAPVTLADYSRAVSAQAVHFDLTADSLKCALNDLVLPANVIRELGAALVTGGAVLLYGSTGNGKTSVAERLHRMFNDLIYTPFAIEVSGQIMTVFDPLIHHAANEQPDTGDPRWMHCARPMVKVGGELQSDMLDARLDDATRICTAPLQVKANNGILLIDDFGRQRITPRELLNRWIVPLDRRKDVLSFSGLSFEIPFELLVVFATNLALSDLAEGAFMRRLRNKIKIDPLTEGLFMELLRRVCEENGIPCSPKMETYIARECLKHSPDGLRACFPNDLVKILRGIAAFEQRTPDIETGRVDEAMRVYFAH